MKLIALLLAVVVPSALGSERIPLTTKSGRSGNAELISLKDGIAELKVYGFGGDATVKRSLDVFTPESILLIELTAEEPKTFDQHFAMAKRAAELDLLPAAGNQCRLAIKAAAGDPDLAGKTKQVRSWAAGALEQMIDRAVAAGDLERATDCLQVLTTRLADQRTEEQLASVIERVDALRRTADGKLMSEREAKLEAKRKAEIERDLGPIRGKIADGDKLLAKARAQSGSTVASAASCEAAVRAYKSAWQGANELASQHKDDVDLQTELGAMMEQIEGSAISAALHAASVLTSQTDFKGATEWVNRILKYDPDNADAKAMLATIQQAAADSEDYRYRWRRRR